MTESLFGSELLASCSEPLEPVRPEAAVFLHPAEAAGLGLRDGEAVRLQTARGNFAVTLRLNERMAKGIAVLPRRRRTPLEIFVPGGGPLDCTLEKEGGA